MRILNSCLLELREYKKGKVLCRIMISNTTTEGQIAESQGIHWLNKSHWKKFDIKMDQLVNEFFNKKLEKSVLVEESFNINQEIDVKVTNSAATLKSLLQFLGYITFGKNDNILALDCLVSCPVMLSEDSQPTTVSESISLSIADDSEKMMHSLNTSMSDISIINENQCSLKLFKTVEKNISSDSSEDFKTAKLTKCEKNHEESPKVISSLAKSNITLRKHKTRSGQSNAKSCHDDNVDLHKYVVKKSERIMEREFKASELKRKNFYDFPHSSDTKLINKNTKRREAIHKLRSKVSDTDAESDDFDKKTPVKIQPEYRATSSLKKRKNVEPSCQQEKQSTSKWLSKKQPEELILAKTKPQENATKKTVNSSSVKNTNRIVYPTTEEIAEKEHREKEQMKANKKIKTILEDLIQVPKKVKILSLNNMTAEEILNTFPKYKSQIDGIFHELKSKPKVTGYNGINHYLVIELIDNEKQLQMMNKLGEVYEKDPDGLCLNPTLFANALMPEWLVNIFKDKYKFSYNEAVSHLNEQRQYMQYMDVDQPYY
uniref:Uncharacterized protein CG4951 n=1 Tax=Ceratitis capitata TaxID=7213 RepID=W8C7B4_CERCA